MLLKFWALWSFSFILASAEPAWITTQYNVSLQMLLDNIFENGTVIASPSRSKPDYYVPGDLTLTDSVPRILKAWAC
jgi:hypothetical protein